jgi:hypothetical protein
MSFQENLFSIGHIIGNVDLPRNLSPVLRSYKRRTDPDGSSSTTYYSGLAGKKLDIEYTDDSMAVQTETLTFTTNIYVDALALISALDPDNIEALDQDGFLAIRNRNTGGLHYLKILPQSVSADEAATILGFEVDPFPGSVSYAGELASAPGSRLQKNPQGTGLLARDDDISSRGFNRAMVSLLSYLEKEKIDLSREVVVVQSVAITFQNNATIAAVDGVAGGSQSAVANVFTINDDTIRIPVHFVSSTNPGGLALEDLFHIIRNGSELQLEPGDGGSRYRVKSVHYSTNPTTVDFRNATNINNTFAVWGTPDDKSIFGTLVGLLQKEKHASIAITEIRGNIVRCAGATFITKKVQPGDTLRITGATNDIPFNHNGEFVIEKIWGEDTISVRAKSPNEPLVFSTDNRPTELNTAGGFGNAFVPIGHYLPASNLVFTLERVAGTSWGLTTAGWPTATLLIKTGKSLRDVSAQAFAKEFHVPPDAVITYMDAHINNGGHPATAITATAPTWDRTSESVGGTNVQTILNNIVAMLSDNETVTTAEYGSSRIGSAAITGTAPDDTPRSLSAGTIKSQLKLVIEYLNNHINDNVAHTGGGGNYSGSPNWHDGTNIPNSVTLDGAVDRIVEDLGGSTGANGADKIATGARTAWLGGKTNPSGSVFDALDKIITDLALTSSNDDGAERIGAQVTGDIPAGSVRSQLDYLAVNWGKLSRANTWTAPNTFNGSSGDTSPSLITATVPSSRKLLWEIANGTGKTRLYATTGGLAWVRGASWNGTSWIPDSGVSTQGMLELDSQIRQYAHFGTTSFTHASWQQYFNSQGESAVYQYGDIAVNSPGSVTSNHYYGNHFGEFVFSGNSTSLTSTYIQLTFSSTAGFTPDVIVSPCSASVPTIVHGNITSNTTVRFSVWEWDSGSGDFVLKNPISSTIPKFAYALLINA